MLTTTAAAAQAIAASMPRFDTEAVPVAAAGGRILRQPVSAERDQPPFDRVTMDGIALSFAAFESGLRRFTIQGTQHAGDPVLSLAGKEHCIEIMTGAVLPQGSDCVVPVERIRVADGVATIESGYAATRQQFVHPRGSDYRAGHTVLGTGLRLAPVDIAILVSCGLGEVVVARQPRVRVVSTGNELVPPGGPILPHQVRMSNGPALVSMLQGQGFAESRHEHLVDDPGLLRARLGEILDETDVLVLSGGVSKGKADFVPDVLTGLGVDVVFHGISQRPGKPMWFGVGPRRQAVFALPGNPVSTLVCCRHYVLPALLDAAGRTHAHIASIKLAEHVSFKPDLTCFMPVRVTAAAGAEDCAVPVPTNTSGDFAALSGTHGYVELAREQSDFPAGSIVPLHRWLDP